MEQDRMSEADNVALIQAVYGDFGSGNIPSMLTKLSPHVEFVSPGSTLPWSGVHRGHEAVGNFFGMLVGALDITAFEPRQFIAQGDKVAVLGYEAASGRKTGKSFEMDFIHLWTVNDGKVVLWQDFYDTASVAAVLT
jgi:ketosteroid isomerase-like protein